MKRKLFWWVLAIGLLVLTMLALKVVEGRASRPFSIIDLCYRPRDVRSIARFHDVATDTLIQFIPTSLHCMPLNFPEDKGTIYIRLQWGD